MHMNINKINKQPQQNAPLHTQLPPGKGTNIPHTIDISHGAERKVLRYWGGGVKDLYSIEHSEANQP